MPTKHLTEKAIKGLQANENYKIFWDENFSAPGSFGVKVSPRTGKKTFVIKVRRKNDTQTTKKIGRYVRPSKREHFENALSLVDAREKAIKKSYELKNSSKKEKDDIETFEELAEHFDEHHIEKKAEETQRKYRERLNKYLLSNLRSESITDIDRTKIFDEILDPLSKRTESVAERCRKLLNLIFNHALERGFIDENPCKKIGTIKKQSEEERDRVLSHDEIKSLWEVLEDEKNRVIAVCFRMVLLTGQRQKEIRKMKWSDIQDRIWTIPAENTKNNEKHEIFLSDQALEQLDSLKPVTGDKKWVFSSPSSRNDRDIVKCCG